MSGAAPWSVSDSIHQRPYTYCIETHLICPLDDLSVVKTFGSGVDALLIVGSCGDDAPLLLVLLMIRSCADIDLRLQQALNRRSDCW
jgi:hypothetical protein